MNQAQIKVKDFGKSIEFASIEQLESSLKQDYKGKSVAIVLFNKDQESKRSVFASVSDTGRIHETYQQSRDIIFSELKDYLN